MARPLPTAGIHPVDPSPEPPTPLPGWFWLLPILALAAWWPFQPYWQSDDYLALHYARSLTRALGDFIGPQYGSQDIWLFYRPLITLSFWFDYMAGGSDPWLAHFSNVLVHGLNALLVGLIGLRFVAPGAAFAAAALWSLQPAHAGALLWTVGRVDGHTVLWCLLSIWLALRGGEGIRGARALSVLACLLALCSKELAFAVPPLVLLVVALRHRGTAAERLRQGLGHSWPHFLLLGLMFGWRAMVLGTPLGGYGGAHLQPLPMAHGLGEIAVNLLNPLRWTAGNPRAEVFASARGYVSWIGLLPTLVAVAFWLRPGRWPGLTALLLLFLVAAAPTAPFWADSGNVHNLRYFYLASIALAAVLALPGRVTIALGLLVSLPALVAIRIDYLRADRESAQMHATLLHHAAGSTQNELFVAGLPHVNRAGSVLQFHYGTDRLLQQPFAGGSVRLLALRPAAEVPGVWRISPPDRAPFALPGGTTLWFADPDDLRPAAAEELPELPLEVIGGTDLRDDAIRRLADNRLQIQIRTPGVRPEAYRVTFFTATGYLCSVIGNHGTIVEPDGHVDLRKFFVEGCWARTGETHVLRGLEVPTIHDLVTEFPALVEAGTLSADARFEERSAIHTKRVVHGDFRPTHRARSLLRFQFDRGYPASVRSVLGL